MNQHAKRPKTGRSRGRAAARRSGRPHEPSEKESGEEERLPSRALTTRLAAYQRKRRFERTPEPRGAAAGRRTTGLAFCVQKHAASHLHYDFRLELHGVLLSWAVPKGPCLDPRERRLAVRVEDHPLEYGTFEGEIPKGQYGGGTVLLWDRGNWIPEGDPEAGLKKGHLKFRLEGRKLRGGWVLVRMGGRAGQDGKNWLLIKENDAEARPAGAAPFLS